MIVALVVMVGFGSCNNHEYDDHSSDLAGTWTCFQENYAEALIISADGSAVSTGVEDGKYWENVAGNIVVKDGEITMTFADNDNFKGHFDIIPGVAFSIYTAEGERYTYNYCKEDLSEEIIGMWVSDDNDGSDLEGDNMAIQTFNEDGKTFLTTAESVITGEQVVNGELEYKVLGDLMFRIAPAEAISEGVPSAQAVRMMYVPNGNSLGDMMYFKVYIPVNGKLQEVTSAFLRIRESLNLAGKKYEYNSSYVSNVKGNDQDIEFMGYTFNFANMDGVLLDKILKSFLFSVEFTEANTIKYNRYTNGTLVSEELAIAVEGNKIAIKMSENNSVYKDVDLYAFQDVDDCQLHMYMSRTAFVNFMFNMRVVNLAESGEIDLTDAAAVEAVYGRVSSAIETINLSIVMKKAN